MVDGPSHSIVYRPALREPTEVLGTKFRIGADELRHDYFVQSTNNVRIARVSKTVFISYRRKLSSWPARSIFGDLKRSGYDVFMDVESIVSG